MSDVDLKMFFVLFINNVNQIIVLQMFDKDFKIFNAKLGMILSFPPV